MAASCEGYLLQPPFASNGKNLSKFFSCIGWQGDTSLEGTYWYLIWLSDATGIIEERVTEPDLWTDQQSNEGVSAVNNDIDAFDPDVVMIESTRA